MKNLIVTANNGLPYVEVYMSCIHNHNFSVYFTLPVLKKRVLIIYHSLYPLSKSEFLSFVLLLAGCAPSSTVSQRKCIPLSQLYEKGTGIAVWDFEITSPNEDVHMNRFLPHKIRKRINKEGHFNLIDRDHLPLSLQELNLGTNLLTDEKTRLRLGKVIGVKLMIYGFIYQYVGNQMSISLRLIEVENRKILSTVEKFYNPALSDQSKWLKSVEKMTPELFIICQ